MMTKKEIKNFCKELKKDILTGKALKLSDESIQSRISILSNIQTRFLKKDDVNINYLINLLITSYKNINKK